MGDGAGDAFGAVGVGGCQRLSDAAQRQSLRVFVSDGVSGAFGVSEEPGSPGEIVSGRFSPLLRHLAQSIPADRAPGALGTAVVPGAADTRSIVVTRRPASEWKLSWRMSSALRRARPARLSGRSSRPGMTASPDQDRNDPHVAGQGGLDFQPDKVIWIVKPPTAPAARWRSATSGR